MNLDRTIPWPNGLKFRLSRYRPAAKLTPGPMTKKSAVRRIADGRPILNGVRRGIVEGGGNSRPVRSLAKVPSVLKESLHAGQADIEEREFGRRAYAGPYAGVDQFEQLSA